MNMLKTIPIYHILHYDKLSSVIDAGGLFSDAEIRNRGLSGTNIGMQKIKDRRLGLTLKAYPTVHVGDCVPFYFCPRSPMLFVLHKGNHSEVSYHEGQAPIIHLQSEMFLAVSWADYKLLKWAFTNSNAGSYYYEDFSNLKDIDKINWEAIEQTDWTACRDEKQAEFLVEKSFSWELIQRIGVYSDKELGIVDNILKKASHRPITEVKRCWYY